MRGLWALTLLASFAWGEIVDTVLSELLDLEYDFIVVGGTQKNPKLLLSPSHSLLFQGERQATLSPTDLRKTRDGAFSFSKQAQRKFNVFPIERGILIPRIVPVMSATLIPKSPSFAPVLLRRPSTIGIIPQLHKMA